MVNSLRIEEKDLREDATEEHEGEAGADSIEGAEVGGALGFIASAVELEVTAAGRLENSGDIVAMAVGGEEAGREEGEMLGLVVVLPVRQGHEDVGLRAEAGDDIEHGHGGNDERAAEEGDDGGVIEAEGSEPEASIARAQLLRQRAVLEDVAQRRHAAQRREQVARQHVVRERRQQAHEEELDPRHSLALLIRFQCPAQIPPPSVPPRTKSLRFPISHCSRLSFYSDHDATILTILSHSFLTESTHCNEILLLWRH